ncbi:hypothetical protein PInf_005358 [Phytophthora infestans]|nr:hypothetical protein PInf_005358 [Phytophthora infestans]
MACFVEREDDGRKKDPCTPTSFRHWKTNSHVWWIEIFWEGTDSDFTPSPDLSGVKDDDSVVKRQRTAPSPAVKASKKKTPLSTQTKAGKKKAAPSSEAADSLFTATPVPLPAPPMSDLGVPLTVKHARKAGTTDDIWDLIQSDSSPKIKIEDLSKDMSIDTQSGMHYALLGLYKHVDVLK